MFPRSFPVLWHIFVFPLVILIFVALYAAQELVETKVEPGDSVNRLPAREVKETSPALEQSLQSEKPTQTVQFLPDPRSELLHRITSALRTGSASDREIVLSKLLPELMENNMPATAKLAETLEPWAWREDVLQQVARAWAQSDPDRATNWALRLPIASERNSVLNQICISLAEQDPQRAMSIAQKCGLGASNSVLIESIAHHWAVKDFTSALRWTERLSSKDLQDKAYAQLALVRSEFAPAAAANLVIERISPGPIQTESAISVLHQWILQDPTGAASWVRRFPPGEVRQRAEDELAGAARYRQPAPNES